MLRKTVRHSNCPYCKHLRIVGLLANQTATSVCSSQLLCGSLSDSKQQHEPQNGHSIQHLWSSSDFTMVIRQGDLPCAIQQDFADPIHRSYLHSPFWFCSATLEHVTGPMDTASNALAGCLVSSLHKVKLQDNIGSQPSQLH